MILIADSGSTKTDWVLHDGNDIVFRTNTQGLNPTLQSAEDIYKVINTELEGKIAPDAPATIFFYGAGCAYETADNRMKKALELLQKDEFRTIQEVCEQVGYTNPTSFAKAFSKVYGVSPTAYRRDFTTLKTRE